MRLVSLVGASEAVGELVGEFPCFPQVVVLDVGRRDLDPEVMVAVLTRPEVAQQRQQRAGLAALVAEVDAVGEGTAAPGAEPADRLEVVFPVPASQPRPRSTSAIASITFRVWLVYVK
jgi:hypothetical protein